MQNLFVELPRLGVGINYQKAFSPVVRQRPDLVHFLELSPDALCSWQLRAGRWQLTLNRELFRQFEHVRGDLPVAVHGLSLSIGSASGMSQSYIALLDSLNGTLPFAWHSEHLGFLDLLTAEGEYLHAGTQLPLPFTEESIELLVPRIRWIIEHYNRPFLLENTSFYLPGMDYEGIDEVEFLNRLCARSGERCGLLLDLYNFYCNALNFGFDPYLALERLDMSRVVEVHVAGGSVHKGFHLDVHSDHVPDAVWDLADWLLPQAPNVKALVYELLEQALDLVTEEGVQANLQRANNSWRNAQLVGQDSSTRERYVVA